MAWFTGISHKGSHTGFARSGEPVQLNFQNRNGRIPAYQAKQLQGMIERYRKFDQTAESEKE
jgi:hypothetical protein